MTTFRIGEIVTFNSLFKSCEGLKVTVRQIEDVPKKSRKAVGHSQWLCVDRLNMPLTKFSGLYFVPDEELGDFKK